MIKSSVIVVLGISYLNFPLQCFIYIQFSCTIIPCDIFTHVKTWDPATRFCIANSQPLSAILLLDCGQSRNSYTLSLQLQKSHICLYMNFNQHLVYGRLFYILFLCLSIFQVTFNGSFDHMNIDSTRLDCLLFCANSCPLLMNNDALKFRFIDRSHNLKWRRK